VERIGRVQLWRTVTGQDIDKEAELANTYDMPAQSPVVLSPTKDKKAVIRKTASANDSGSTDDDILADAFKVRTDVQPATLPQMGALSPHVDVSKEDAPKPSQEKKAQHYALPSMEQYPLDSYAQVKAACAYFEENVMLMVPEDRHEYCVNLVKRASALDIKTGALIEKYGSAGYAPEGDIELCLDARRAAIQNPEHLGVLDKLAASRASVEPELFASALEQLDKVASIDGLYGGDVPDAYFTTFGKTAEELQEKTDPDESIVVGNEYLTRRRLATYCQNNAATLSLRFGAEVGKALVSDPNDIFDTLPRDQKLVLMRMANNDDSAVQQGVPTA
jgi:hypothetical protein